MYITEFFKQDIVVFGRVLAGAQIVLLFKRGFWCFLSVAVTVKVPCFLCTDSGAFYALIARAVMFAF